MNDAWPTFAALPIHPSLPPRSAWSVFGVDDEIGTLNFQSSAGAAAAAGLVRRGDAYPLNWEVDLPSPPLFGRRPPRHRVIDLDVGTEDTYDDFYPQGSTQWDALAHIGHPEYGFYNGVTREQVTGLPGSRDGIDHWARRGIVGRFVLCDLVRWRASIGRPLRPDRTDAVTVDEVESCLDTQGVTLGTGDVLLLRFGWVGWYASTQPDQRQALAGTDFFPAAGLANEVRTAQWLWDHRVAAVAADNPALEAMPFDESGEDGYLHYRLIPLLGLAIGELFVLDALADACASDGVYEGLICAAPLNKVGGSGSPANAIALR